jgi:hypothetical protein
MSILHTPERLARRKREEPPRYMDWAERHGLEPEGLRFGAAFAAEHRYELVDEVMGAAESGESLAAIARKWEAKRQEAFEAYWFDLPEELR